MSVFIVSNAGLLVNINKNLFDSCYNIKKESEPQTSNGMKERIIVFFNQSTYDPYVKVKFQEHGGILNSKNDWNNRFTTISGFAGTFPIENITLLKNEFPNINIEVDEIITLSGSPILRSSDLAKEPEITTVLFWSIWVKLEPSASR